MVLNGHTSTLREGEGLTPGVTSGWDQASCGVWALHFLSHLCFQERRKCRGTRGCVPLPLSWEANPYLVQPLRKGVGWEGRQGVVDLSCGLPTAKWMTVLQGLAHDFGLTCTSWVNRSQFLECAWGGGEEHPMLLRILGRRKGRLS